MASPTPNVKDIFDRALEISPPAERDAFLDGECATHPEVRQAVESLLRAHIAAGDFLESGAVATGPLAAGPDVETMAAEEVAADPLGVTVDAAHTGPDSARPRADEPDAAPIAGRYKIRQAIGEGGMGAVYLAEQLSPVRRTVALKLIKPGMDSRQVLARFESERQALALMDHPNIAKVLDAGTTANGRPFFVMELVKGIPLTSFCDRHRLDLPTRLNLFRQICSAVQHAHQKGVIHRDLKPSNILVEDHDGQPVPRVIDFGLAKATGGLRLTEDSLLTALGSIAGTPLYMAPEQATFSALDVDTRADIYSLGVILYELLTGSTPIRRDSIKQAALEEMFRRIREEEPPTPSSRISTSEALPSLAANRHIEPARLSRLVRGDLDWIVMKALAKERSRRYDSAIGLANDIDRFLNHEPVSAGPPTAAYRARKFVRRHRGRVAAVAAVVLALVAGVVGTTWGIVEARHQRRLALDQVQETQRRLGQRDRANAILLGIFRDLNLRGHDQEAQPLADRLADRLEQAASALQGESTDDPAGVAQLQSELGLALLSLGRAQQAVTLFDRALATSTSVLGPKHLQTISDMSNLALAHIAAGQPDRARPLADEAQARMRSVLGPNHPDTLIAMGNLGMAYRNAGQVDLALRTLEEVQRRMRTVLGSDHPSTLIATNNLAMAYDSAGRPGLALPLLEEIQKPIRARFGPDHPDTLQVMSSLAKLYITEGQADRARPLLKEAAERMRSKLGPDHPSTIIALERLGLADWAAGQPGLALPLLEKALDLSRTRHGPDHPSTLLVMGNLGMVYIDAGKLDRAIPFLEETLTLRKAKLGLDHSNTITTMVHLGRAYSAAGRRDLALPLLQEALARREATLGPDHPDTYKSMNDLATAHARGGQHGLAVPLLEKARDALEARLGPDHPDTLATMANLAKSYGALERTDQAQALFKEVLKRRRRRLGPDHPRTLATMNDLAVAYRNAGKLELAVPLCEEALTLMEAKLGPDHSETQPARTNLGVFYREAGRLDAAIPMLEAAHNSLRGHPDQGKVTPELLMAYELAGDAAKAIPLTESALAEARAALPADSARLGGVLAAAARTFLVFKDWERAESILRECLAIREKTEPEAWATFNARSMLGGALAGQRKFDEAAPLVRSGYDEMAARADSIPRAIRALRLSEALDRLIDWGEATGQAAEMEAWKAERSRLVEAGAPPAPDSHRR